MIAFIKRKQNLIQSGILHICVNNDLATTSVTVTSYIIHTTIRHIFNRITERADIFLLLLSTSLCYYYHFRFFDDTFERDVSPVR